MAFWLLLSLLGALILLHMIRPRFERRRISAARFFGGLPPARKGQPRLRLSSPVRSRPLYLQVPLLLALLAAILLVDKQLSERQTLGFGVWILIDSSASMTTNDGRNTRFQSALDQARTALNEARQTAGGKPVCYRLSTFDLAIEHLSETTDASVLADSLNLAKPRALGTDLNLVRGLLASLDAAEGDCNITHLVVVSDIPAPDWLVEDRATRVIWRHVGAPVGNVGFTRIGTSRDPLTGFVRSVEMTVTAYGNIPGITRLRVTGPDGTDIFHDGLGWSVDGLWRGSFVPDKPGRYLLALEPGGDYLYDDRAEIQVGAQSGIRVDWQLTDRGLPDRLGWEQDRVTPHLRVAPLPINASPVPTLYVGNGYTNGTRGEIRDFYEGSSLLADLNLDVVENLQMGTIPLPQGFQAVLRRTDDQVWLAERADPIAAYVPGLPIAGEKNLSHFSSTTFFNGVKWLLGERPAAPLYELTSPADPIPDGTRLALHPDEGNTLRGRRSYGDLEGIKPVPIGVPAPPLWPALLTLAVALFVAERLLSCYGGPKWR